MSDTTCLKSRSLLIPDNDNNEFLFPSAEIDSQNIFYNLLELAVADKINFYAKDPCENQNILSNQKDHFLLQYLQYSEDTVINSGIHHISGKTGFFNYCFSGTYGAKHQITLKFDFDLLSNYLGEDSVIQQTDGTFKYAYPPSIIYKMDLLNVKVKIIERRFYNPNKERIEFYPSEIGYEFFDENTKSIKNLWVNFDELNFAMKTHPYYLWYPRL